jgi:hypothetical protein
MKTKMHYKMSLVGVFLLAGCLLSAPALLAYTGTLTDDFNGPSLNTGLWSDISWGGPSISQTAGQLQISFPSNPTSQPPFNNFQGAIQSKFILVGDFDMQVNFSLITWPTNDGINLGFGNMTESGGAPRGMVAVERVGARSGFQESYLVDFFGTLSSIVPTGDSLGGLRLVRTGDTMEGFYLNSSNQWVSLGARSNPSFGFDTTIGLGPSSGPGSFGGQAALMAYDNFQVQYTGIENLVPIPPTCLLLGSGLLCLGFPGLRRRMKKS